MDTIEKISNYWVCQSNKFMETSFSMTTMEQKIIRIIASMIKKEDVDFKECNFNILSLCDMLKANKTSIYRELERVSKLLMTRVIKIKNPYKKNTWIMYHVIKCAKCENGIFSVQIDEEMKDFYLFLKEFTRYRLGNILGLRHAYSFKIYELLKQYESFKTREIELDILKEYLDVQCKYKNYYEFKRRVLLPSQEEINRETDIYFDFEEIKRGKLVVAIRFIIKTKDKLIESQIELKNIHGIKEDDKDKEAINDVINDFNSKYDGNLDYILTKNLVKTKGIDCVRECIEEFSNFVSNAKEVEKVFYDFTKKYGTDRAYVKSTSYNNMVNAKPIQSTNYDQREYDDEFFNSLYDNVKFTKK